MEEIRVANAQRHENYIFDGYTLDEKMYLGHRVLIPSILIILHFFFLLIRFKNYFIFKETKFQSSLFRRIYCLKKMNS